MFKSFLLALYFIWNLFVASSNGQCLQEVISNTQYKCGRKSGFNSSSSTFPSKIKSGTQELAITSVITIDDTCSSSYPSNLFTIKISPKDQQNEIAIFRYEISEANTVTLFTEDQTGIQQINSWPTTEAIQKGSSFELYVYIGTETGYIQIFFATGSDLYNTGTNVMSYKDWKFDETTRFEFCTDSSGMNIGSCTVSSLSVEYQNSRVGRGVYQFLGGVTPVLVGSYSLDQTSGSTIKDDAKALGSAILGSSTALIPNGKAPKWIIDQNEAGLEFTDSDQYVLLPTFQPKSITPATLFCFTLSFWLKIENDINNSGYIFRYSRSDLTQNIFSIILEDNYFHFEIGPTREILFEATPLYSVWNQMTVTFSCFNYSTICFIMWYINGTYYSRYGLYGDKDYILPFKPSDKVLLGGPGGFKGKILKLQIFNPGTQRLVIPSCDSSSSSCLANLGALESTNKNCLLCSANVNTTKFYKSCRICPSGTYLSGEECIIERKEEVQTFPGAAASKGTTAAAKGMTTAVSAVSSGSSAGATAAISGKVFSNIKFINISYSNELENALTTWTPNYLSLGFNTDMPDSLEKRFVNASVPYVFAKNQVNSCFLINFWEPLMMLLILILFFIVILVLDWLVSLKKNLNKKSIVYRIITRAKVMLLNFLIVQMYGMYGDVVFYAAIDFHNTQMTAGLNLLSLFAIIFLVGAMLFGFFLHINLLKRYQNVKRYFGGNPETKQTFDNFLNDHEGIQVIFGDFKDSSLGHQSFLFILTVRDLLFSLILTTLFDYPLVECILILLMNIAMLVYLLIKRPFKDLVAQIQQVVLELITMLVNICVLIMAAWDHRRMEAFDGRTRIGKILIVTNMIFNFVIVGFMLFNLFRQGWEVYKEYKERNKGKRLKVKAPRNVLNLQNTTSLDESSKRADKNLESDVTITDFVRNNSETCQTIIKADTFRNNQNRNHFLNHSQVLETSVVIDSTKNGLDESRMLPNLSVFTPMSNLKSTHLKKSQHHPRRRKNVDTLD